MNIKKLIADKRYAITGLTRANMAGPGHTYHSPFASTKNIDPKAKTRMTKRTFAIAFNDPIGDGKFMVTNIVFDMTNAWGTRSVRSAEEKMPWENRRRISKEAVHVDDKEVEEMKNDPDLKKLIEDWSEELAYTPLQKLPNLSFDGNNMIVADQEREKVEQADKKAVADYADTIDPDDNYWWYSEWDSSYDPYNGSGKTTLANICISMGARTKEKVDELYKKLESGETLVRKDGRVIYQYGKTKVSKIQPVNENQKVTLTIKQLRKLVVETARDVVRRRRRG